MSYAVQKYDPRVLTVNQPGKKPLPGVYNPDQPYALMRAPGTLPQGITYNGAGPATSQAILRAKDVPAYMPGGLASPIQAGQGYVPRTGGGPAAGGGIAPSGPQPGPIVRNPDGSIGHGPPNSGGNVPIGGGVAPNSNITRDANGNAIGYTNVQDGRGEQPVIRAPQGYTPPAGGSIPMPGRSGQPFGGTKGDVLPRGTPFPGAPTTLPGYSPPGTTPRTGGMPAPGGGITPSTGTVYSTAGGASTDQGMRPTAYQEKQNLAGTLAQNGVGQGPAGTFYTDQSLVPTAGQETQNYARNLEILQQQGGTYTTANGGGVMMPNGQFVPTNQGGGAQTGGGPISGTLANDPFLADWNNKYDTARASNEDRYKAIRGGADDTQGAMGGYLGRFDRNMQRLEGMGTQELKDVNQQYDRLGGNIAQDMVSRGLSGTTIKPTMEMGLARERGDALSRVNERLQRERIDTDARLSGDQLQFMERRTDAYPNAEFLANLAKGMGQSIPMVQPGALSGPNLSGVPVIGGQQGYGTPNQMQLPNIPRLPGGGQLPIAQGGGGQQGGQVGGKVGGGYSYPQPSYGGTNTYPGTTGTTIPPAYAPGATDVPLPPNGSYGGTYDPNAYAPGATDVHGGPAVWNEGDQWQEVGGTLEEQQVAGIAARMRANGTPLPAGFNGSYEDYVRMNLLGNR